MSVSSGILFSNQETSNELSQGDIQELLDNIELLDPDEQNELLQIAATLETRESARACREDLIEFCKAMQEGYLVGSHHKVLAKLLMEVERGEKDRITVSIAPRMGKSQLGTIFFAAWYLGRNPSHKVMIVSHTADLAVDFGRKVRNLIDTQEYQNVFPGVQLAVDSKSAGRWSTSQGGEFFATGVGSNLAGRGAHMLIVDDPISEQALLAGDFESLDKVYEWFRSGARPRLMSGGKISVVATRWHKMDLIGRLIRDMTLNPKADQYEVVEFPAIIDEHTENERALWPELFPISVLQRTRESMPAYQWNAQYQQNPTGGTSSICKREWWRRWEKDEPPECEYIIQALDAASELNNRADYTSIGTWGVWFNEEENTNQLILLNSVRERYEFPELKVKALEQFKYWEPDALLVEKKSSGTALYQELRRMGVPVSDYTPHRGAKNDPNTKFARLNSVTDMLKEGLVWAPATRWADELIEELAEFPNGEHDDRVDTTIMVLTYFRKGGFVRLASDESDDDITMRKRRAYY